jgi:hypothetical protein
MALKVPAIVASVVGLLALAGCGGSGSGSGGGGSSGAQANLMSATAPSQPVNLPSTTLTATDSSGNMWTVTYSAVAGGTAMFNGQNADTSAIALTISENGVVASTEDSTAYYLVSPYSPLGLSGTTNGVAWTAVISGYTPFPAMLTVGDTGPISTATYYDGMGNNIGSLTETYTVTANNATSLLLNIDGAGTINGVQETETLTYSIGSDGSVLGLTAVQVTVNGTTLTFTPS